MEGNEVEKSTGKREHTVYGVSRQRGVYVREGGEERNKEQEKQTSELEWDMDMMNMRRPIK